MDNIWIRKCRGDCTCYNAALLTQVTVRIILEGCSQVLSPRGEEDIKVGWGKCLNCIQQLISQAIL